MPFEDLRALVATTRITPRTETVARGIDEPEFECRRSGQNLFQLIRVLYAGQLHDDTVGSLSLNQGLGDTELVDAISEGRRVLFDRKILAGLDLSFAHANSE